MATTSRHLSLQQEHATNTKEHSPPYGHTQSHIDLISVKPTLYFNILHNTLSGALHAECYFK